MPRKATKRGSKKRNAQKQKLASNESQLFAFLATFLTIIGFIIALVAKRDDKYVMFYAKQGLVLFIIQIIISIVDGIPFLGGFLFEPILWILFIVAWFIAWANALSGKMKNTWLIGKFAKKIKI